MRNLFHLKIKNRPTQPAQYTKECVHVKKIILVKRKNMLRFDGKNIQELTKYLNHLDI